MKSIGNQEFCEDFLLGMQDCEDGVPHKSGSEAYDRGYNAQYELEQVRGAEYDYNKSAKRAF